MISYILQIVVLFLVFDNQIAYADEPPKILITPYRVSYFDFFDKFKVVGQGKIQQYRSYFASNDGKVDFSLPIAGTVKAGQLILAIDKNTVTANKESNEWSYKNTQIIHARNQQLFKKSIISADVLDVSEAKMRNALLELHKAQSNYETSVITAPFNGEIGVIKVKSGHYVHKGDFLFSLINTGTMVVTFELPEILYGKVLTSTEILLKNNKNEESLGKVISVSPYLSNEGTFTVEVTTENGKFIHNSYLVGEFIVDQHQGLAVPEHAILRNNKESFIYLINSNKVVTKTLINTGVRVNDMVEITSHDIIDGSLVVLEGLTKVSNDMKVEFSN
ncbi:MAG: efflux RND transporter periplasmic adaptor subunit [Rickettsiaceae bacterium]|nr:MAG: efflux RND transporter periplasmic adaptor subunit [Rickettsiaceae bacterium]